MCQATVPTFHTLPLAIAIIGFATTHTTCTYLIKIWINEVLIQSNQLETEKYALQNWIQCSSGIHLNNWQIYSKFFEVFGLLSFFQSEYIMFSKTKFTIYLKPLLQLSL